MTQMDLGLNLSIRRTRKREFLDEIPRGAVAETDCAYRAELP